MFAKCPCLLYKVLMCVSLLNYGGCTCYLCTSTHPCTELLAANHCSFPLFFQLMNNEEITNIVKILGLHYSKKYTDSTELRSLRYGKLLIMTDQDQDGSHIKGLVINFLHHNWPGLLRHSFVQQFITPIVKVS